MLCLNQELLIATFISVSAKRTLSDKEEQLCYVLSNLHEPGDTIPKSEGLIVTIPVALFTAYINKIPQNKPV